LNNPLPDDTKIFDRNNFKFFKVEDVDIKKLSIYAFADISLGKRYDSDYTAIIVLGKDDKDNNYVLDAVIARLKPSDTIESIISLYKIYKFKQLGVESNNFQVLFTEQVEKAIADRGIYFYIEKIMHMTNKEARIRSIEPFIRNGKILFREDWELAYKLLINQLEMFPISAHDDAPDALEGCMRLTESSLGWFKGFGS
jgi:predicted phage terminase large subunit-like protein